MSRRTGATQGGEPTVLIGFAEALAAIEAAWSLQAAGFRVAAFHRAGSKPALRHVRSVDIHEVPRPEEDAAAAVDAVQALCDVLAPAALLPLDDHALWACSRLEDLEASLAGASGYAADCALDKSLQLEMAREAGLPVPRTQMADALDAPSLLSHSRFPVMVKPTRALYEVNGVLQRPTGVVCASSQELERAARRPWPGPVLIQPLILGVGEGLFGHVGQRGITGWTAHRRIRMVNPQGSASSACRSASVDERLIEPAERFLTSIGWRGMFMLEFLRDADGTPWFMELNGRAWGSMALARRRGFEYPAWTVRGALDPQFEPVVPPDPPELACRNLGLELAHLAFVARGPQSSAPVQWPRLGRAIRDVFSFSPSDRLYNWNRSQPSVLLADTVGTLRQYAAKMTGRRP